MDNLRAAHRVHCRFAVDGGHEVWVRWYPCLPGAKPVPFAHAFLSGVWEGDHDEPPVGPGMLYDWQARSNKFPDAQPGDQVHGLEEWWAHGLPESAFALTGGDLPPRDCEAFVALDVQDITAGTLNADYPDASVIQVDRAKRLDVVPGHTLMQLVLGWTGASVGVEGGSRFDGVYSILFEVGSTVEPVDAQTVLVTGPPTVPYRIVDHSSLSAWDMDGSELGAVVLTTWGPDTTDLIALPPSAALAPGWWCWFTAQGNPGVPIRIAPAGTETATLDGVAFSLSGTLPGLTATGDTYLLLCTLVSEGHSEWISLVRPSQTGGGAIGGHSYS